MTPTTRMLMENDIVKTTEVFWSFNTFRLLIFPPFFERLIWKEAMRHTRRQPTQSKESFSSFDSFFQPEFPKVPARNLKLWVLHVIFCQGITKLAKTMGAITHTFKAVGAEAPTAPKYTDGDPVSSFVMSVFPQIPSYVRVFCKPTHDLTIVGLI